LDAVTIAGFASFHTATDRSKPVRYMIETWQSQFLRESGGMPARCHRAFLFTAFCALLALVSNAVAEEKPRHVLLVVWDGMRPDFVTEKYAPTLDRLAHDGVRFLNHHSVYPTATYVNGAALATGAYPNHNGLYANLAFQPAINPRQPIDIGEPDTINRGDEISGGKYLALQAIAELVRSSGQKVALAGTKSVALLFDRHNDWTIARTRDKQLTIFAAAPMSAGVQKETTDLLGPFLSESNATSAQRNTYTTRALTEVLWRDGVPDFSLLWLSEPDLSQHNYSPGSPEAIAAIKAVDQNLAAVLNALNEKHARDSTDVFVVSDHGFSTIRRSIDLVALLNAACFHAAKEFSEKAKPGDILVCGNGGSAVFYVKDHHPAVVGRLIEWLEQSDFAGIVFADNGKGAFPLSQGYIDAADAPDVVMSFRWYGDKNKFGVPGLIDADWNRKAGEGTHATLSPYDVHNTLIAAGPDLRHGFEDDLPTGNIDLAPTILRILGIAAPAQFQGRELAEAFPENKGSPAASQARVESAVRVISNSKQGPGLKISSVRDSEYIDQGDSDGSTKPLSGPPAH
jgi:arylsulfatase A-like enzyme